MILRGSRAAAQRQRMPAAAALHFSGSFKLPAVVAPASCYVELDAVKTAASSSLLQRGRAGQGLDGFLAAAGVTPRILQLNFFFSLLAKIRALPFPFPFPSLNLDLFQSSSGIRFGFPV
jgi:hypothetical protein